MCENSQVRITGVFPVLPILQAFRECTITRFFQRLPRATLIENSLPPITERGLANEPISGLVCRSKQPSVPQRKVEIGNM